MIIINIFLLLLSLTTYQNCNQIYYLFIKVAFDTENEDALERRAAAVRQLSNGTYGDVISIIRFILLFVEVLVNQDAFY